MNDRLKAVLMVAVLQMGASASATAHIVPWRDGETRMKGFGHCAKGPCMKRYDFSGSKPHHHHGSCVVLSSVKHSAYETCIPTTNRRM